MPVSFPSGRENSLCSLLFPTFSYGNSSNDPPDLEYGLIMVLAAFPLLAHFPTSSFLTRASSISWINSLRLNLCLRVWDTRRDMLYAIVPKTRHREHNTTVSNLTHTNPLSYFDLIAYFGLCSLKLHRHTSQVNSHYPGGRGKIALSPSSPLFFLLFLRESSSCLLAFPQIRPSAGFCQDLF